MHFDTDEATGGAAAIPTRDQIKPEDTWDLSLLYPTPADWEASIDTLGTNCAFASLTFINSSAVRLQMRPRRFRSGRSNQTVCYLR